MKSLPIRLRLTVWYFLVFATAALMLSLTSWWMLRHTLDATIHQDLQERVDDIQIQLRRLGPDTPLPDANNYFKSAYQFRDDGKWLQIIAADGPMHGQSLYRSSRMEGINVPRAMDGRSSSTMIETKQGPRTVRIMVAKVNVNSRAYYVETGISMTKPHALLHDFGLGLLLLTPAVLLLAAVGGHFMSRKALAPVAVIAHEARRITDRNLETRLPVSETNDELSHLSVTLNHMLGRIDFAFRSVRDFTANASHELRTPLARLRTQVEIALFRPRDPEEYRQALDHVLQDAVEMSLLVENLLTLARAEAGSEVLSLTPLDLSSLLRDLAREWTPLAERLSIDLKIFTEPSGDQPLFVLGDRMSLMRLLRIFLDNACKFTPAGGFVTVTASYDETSVLIAVEDSGIGIAPEHQTRVFERFYRVSGDTGRHTSGAGLGLSLAAWIAEQHRTSIVVKSAVGQGSRFQIVLARLHDTGMSPQEYEHAPASDLSFRLQPGIR